MKRDRRAAHGIAGRSRCCRAIGVALALLGACGCGGDDDSASEPPQIAALIDETGDGVAAIGEGVSLIGVTGDDVIVRIDGRSAAVTEVGVDAVSVRVPAGVAAGFVDVVAENSGGVSAPASLQVRRLALTADFSDRTVSVLAVEQSRITQLGTIPVDVPPGPFAVAFTPDGRTAVAPCGIGFLPDSIVAVLAPGAPPGDSVAIIDVVLGETVAVVRTGDDSIPTGVATHPDGRRAYVTNYGTSTVSVIDLEERRLITNVDVPRQPEEAAVRADGAVLMVNSVGGSVSLIDTETLEILATVITGGNDPSGVAWSPDGKVAYVANSFTDPDLGEDGTLTVLDVSDPSAPSVVETIADDIGPTPYDVDVAPDGGRAVITNLNVIFDPLSIGPGSLALLDLDGSNTVTTLPVGNAPIRAALSSDGAIALVGNGLDQSVALVDLAQAEVAVTLELTSRVGPADVAIQP